jgi:HNH endonuclease/AP2 domain
LPKYVDHIDGNKLNNNIENLRETTATQNAQNRKIHKNNTSGVKGVYFNKYKKWVAQLKIDNKVTYLGSFDDIKLAENAVKEARSKNHGVFCKHA